MGEFNIAPNTQIGRIQIDNKIYDNENAYNMDESVYNRGGEFIENLVTDNMIEFCHRWFKLSNITEMIGDINEFFALRGFANFNQMIESPLCPILPCSNESNNAISFNGTGVEVPFVIYNKRNPIYNYYNLSKEE